MLDIAFIRQNADIVRAAVTNKRLTLDVTALLEADKQRREIVAKLDERRARKNALSATIPKAPAEDRAKLVAEAKEVRGEIEQLEPALLEANKVFDDLMLRVPSIPRPEVPLGKGEDDNVEVRKVGAPPAFDFTPKDHVELMASLGLVNWDGPRRFAGARSYALVGHGAILELAVTRLAVDLLAARGMSIAADELFLVGTSEVALVSLHADETLEEDALPIRYAGLSSCFRREAGAHGKDTRGLYRVHQFTKVEQVVFCLPDEEVAEKEHYTLLGNAEAILEKLEIPYRVALACTGEIGLGQTRKHEVESWMPGRNAYAETHSCSTLGDFQSRRSNIRLRRRDGSLGYPYTLNNTAIASPRILIPLLENHQQADGSVRLPKALVPYMNGVEVLRPKG
jgi:seryl-tRNA synthetase